MIEHDDYKIEIINCAYFKNEGMKPIKMKYYELTTGKLFISLKDFEGFIFYDKYNNFYNTIQKKIYFHDKGPIFVGDKDKEAFSLFDNYADIEKKIKDKRKQMKNCRNKKKNEIENEIIEELKNKLENFDLNKVILKNGKYYDDSDSLNEGNYIFIQEKNYEFYENNIKRHIGYFIQTIKNNIIYIKGYGEYQIFYENYNYKGEIFYNKRIGKGKLSNQDNEKFYFFPDGFLFEEIDFKEIESNEDNIFYKVRDDERLILIENKNAEKNHNPVTIIVKDRYNKKIIYQIEVRKEKDKLTGNGIVKDFRTGELLLVNFDTNNIISNDILKDIPKYKDKEEFEMHKKSKKLKKMNY